MFDHRPSLRDGDEDSLGIVDGEGSQKTMSTLGHLDGNEAGPRAKLAYMYPGRIEG